MDQKLIDRLAKERASKAELVDRLQTELKALDTALGALSSLNGGSSKAPGKRVYKPRVKDVQCPDCGNMFSGQGYGAHRRTHDTAEVS